jgi:hypothetical protein
MKITTIPQAYLLQRPEHVENYSFFNRLFGRLTPRSPEGEVG